MVSLVTGAGGFTGKQVTRHLLASGARVRAMVRNDAADRELTALGAETVRADVTDIESMRRAMAGVDTIHHIAALFRQAGLPSSEFYRVNVEGTRNVLECAIEAGVQRVVHCSTVGVLGNVENPPADESAPYSPGDPYQDSKMEGEKLFLDYTARGKISGVVIRPAMIYGPGDTRTGKMFKMIANRRFFYVGKGDALVHFVDVRDLAESFRLAGEKKDVTNEVFIIAGESTLPLRHLVKIIADLLGVPEPWLSLPVRPMQALGSLCETICKPLNIEPPIFRRRVDFFTKNRSFDCSKAHRVLGYRPSKSLVHELVDIIDYYVDTGFIDGGKIQRPSTMLRTMDGRISLWDENARSVYGWSREQAVGNVSHSLLHTRFPAELDSINAKLERSGQWRGSLVHRARNGDDLTVDSTWKLLKLPGRSEKLVLELNRSTQKSRGFLCQAACIPAPVWLAPFHVVGL